MSGNLPLAGVRIIDFSQMGTGPYCTHLLTLLGAECIKIETAVRLDMYRRPHPVYGRLEPARIDQTTSGKLSIRLNLKHPGGVELAKRLVAIGDIVAENFRPGVMQRLGLGYETLRDIKPDIVMVSISAAGQTGADSKHAGYAPLFGAAGGLGMMTGFPDGPPVEVRHIMDYGAGLNAAAAVLCAFLRKRRTGQGIYVDVAAREVATSQIGDALIRQAVDGNTPTRAGNEMVGKAPHNVYQCVGIDAWISISIVNDAQWLGFIQATRLTEIENDPRYRTQEARWQNRTSLDEIVTEWTRHRDKSEMTTLLQAVGVPAFPSCTSADITSDAHLLARGAIQPMVSRDGEVRKMVGLPWIMEKSPVPKVGLTPSLGEHDSYVFGELLGLSDARINELVAEGAIQ